MRRPRDYRCDLKIGDWLFRPMEDSTTLAPPRRPPQKPCLQFVEI